MPLPTKNSRINRPSIRDEVYNSLLDWIMDGTLKPGEKIVDKELAGHLGVSRTPVREALRRLEDKDLIESSANRWTRVAQISPREPEMIYPIIWTLENLALAEAAGKLGEQDFQKMEAANRELKAAIDNNDPLAASKADELFHDIFIEGSRNIILIKILQDLKVRYRRLEVNFFQGTSYAKTSVEEHSALIDAMKQGSVEKAQGIIHMNWKKSLERFKDMMPALEGEYNDL